ncbi:MAG: cupin domain-containing protein [Alphaproteobacteria bacterium]|nr:cupin domain-containing protein [Alphaproteobacteria bacterium]
MQQQELGGGRQSFAFNHLDERDFKPGLRPYARYRDLGFAAASGGVATAQVIRMTPPCTDEVRQWHTHGVQFQMVYVLKGWIETQMEGHDPLRMVAGSSWIQPPGIRHRVMNYSDDCEMLEIVLPADFRTDPCDAP